MITINKTTQTIGITRGDYAAIVFSAYEEDGTTLYQLHAGDSVQLQIGAKYGEPIMTLTKTKADGSETTIDDYTFEIFPEATKDLKFGRYVYDVSIITTNGEVYTYIGNDGTKQPSINILKEVGSNG